MKWIYMVTWTILIVPLVVTTRVNKKYKSVEKNLIRNLLTRYKKFGVIGRPVNQSDNLIVVKYGLALIQILGLEENKQILRTNCWSRYTWRDILLQWDPANFSGIKQIRIFPQEIWTPDIKLHNFADERLSEYREARVVISNDGTVLWIPQALFKSTCPVTITYFPFDTQVCKLEFGSWTYDTTQLSLDWWHGYNDETKEYYPIPYVDYTDYVDSNEWVTDGQAERLVKSFEMKRQIKSIKKLRVITERNHLGENVTRYYHILEYGIRMKRNSSFYVFILVIPCLLLSCLTLVLFWLPPESPAKMMLGMNIFVAFFILLLLLAESTPSSVKNFPLIGAYFCLNMILITLSTFLAALVLNLYFRGDSKGRVPTIIRRLFIDGLGKLIMAGQQEVSTIHQGILFTMNIGKTKSNKNLATSSTQKNFQLTHAAFRSKMRKQLKAGKKGENDDEIDAGDKIQPNDKEAIGNNNFTLLEKDLSEIKSYIQEFVNRQKQHTMKSIVSQEWRSLALILDRMFFCLYVTAIFIALIVLIPFEKNYLIE